MTIPLPDLFIGLAAILFAAFSVYQWRLRRGSSRRCWRCGCLFSKDSPTRFRQRREGERTTIDDAGGGEGFEGGLAGSVPSLFLQGSEIQRE